MAEIIKKENRVDYRSSHPVFTLEMKKTHTILIPNMLPTHFEIMKVIFELEGYEHVVVLDNESRAVIDEGLKHVHNDTCYPALCVIGQYIDALKSGKYDPERTAVLITQSGGGCRASNYVPLIPSKQVWAYCKTQADSFMMMFSSVVSLPSSHAPFL